MAKHPRTYSAERGDVFVSGHESKTAAKAALEQAIDFACEVHYPRVETFEGWTLVFASTCNGWQSCLIAPHGTGCAFAIEQGGWTHHSARDFRDVQQSGRIALAQATWKPEFDALGHAQCCKLNCERQDEFMRWAKFQRDYAAARARGLSDNEAFHVAHGHGELIGIPA